MYEVKENRRTLGDGTEITTYTRDVVSCNILEVEAGTNGYQGGDSGHGSRTYFRIKDEGLHGYEYPTRSDRYGGSEVLRSPSAATASWKP
jgi:hypothetical protein